MSNIIQYPHPFEESLLEREILTIQRNSMYELNFLCIVGKVPSRQCSERNHHNQEVIFQMLKKIMKYFIDASLSVKFSMVYVIQMHLVCPTTFPDFVTNCFFSTKREEEK